MNPGTHLEITAAFVGTRAKDAEKRQRRVWAERILAPVRSHPKQFSFVNSQARLKASDKNRRAGGTEGVGRWLLARLIANDNWLTWVYTETLGEYSENWICRTSNRSALDLMHDAGLTEGVDFFVSRYGRKIVRSISFSWGSHLRVLTLGDAGKLQRGRGGAPNDIMADEAQKMPYLLTVIQQVVGAASADFESTITFVGTPGPEVDTYFHQIVTGQKSGWEVHHFYSTDNPFFGDTWRARYERAVLGRLQALRDDYGLTDDHITALLELTEVEFHLLARGEDSDMSPRVRWLFRSLPPNVLREFFGRWVAETTQYIFASVREVGADAFWSRWADGLTRVARGDGTGDDLMAATDLWPARVRELPTVVTPWGPRQKAWQAIVGVDYGYYPDPFGLFVWAHSWEHETLLEWESGKARRLSEPEQFAVLKHWTARLLALGFEIAGIVADTGGAEAMPVVQGWSDRLSALFPLAHLTVEAAEKSNKWSQLWQMNAELRLGRLKFLEHSPAAVEAKYLQRIPPDPDKGVRKAQVHKHRVISADGHRFVPGNDCLDPARYAWWWSCHHLSRQHDRDTPVDQYEQMRRDARAHELSKKGR